MARATTSGLQGLPWRQVKCVKAADRRIVRARLRGPPQPPA
jgi:hypothetical protein